MAQAKIYWDMENYAQVEKIFRKSVEFCNENDIWKLNVAHVLFMQENKFKEATGFYEPIVKKHYDNVSKQCGGTSYTFLLFIVNLIELESTFDPASIL
jgi:tetratricopeptide (TPR) repeat protein